MNNNFIKIGLYIHIPWCIKKCPYCDFNSYKQTKEHDINIEKSYIKHLLTDLQNNLYLIKDRKINTIFIGGGTPSLFHPNSIKFLIYAIKKKLKLLLTWKLQLK
ncbi:radical SAM protein [Candidatus Tachikawaea gelatinosa]|uniref:radical SAM protein n=1 Tax=Candidatus Tachikawaea gelatinosa TaxID=1410383 RepID=UPI000AA91ED1|nr:radical SAM protein [Candidatus Tachikawaea gelatinosa]